MKYFNVDKHKNWSCKNIASWLIFLNNLPGFEQSKFHCDLSSPLWEVWCVFVTLCGCKMNAKKYWLKLTQWPVYITLQKTRIYISLRPLINSTRRKGVYGFYKYIPLLHIPIYAFKSLILSISLPLFSRATFEKLLFTWF